MQQLRGHEVSPAEELWLVLVRAACVPISLGDVTGVSVSRRFDPSVSSASLDQLAKVSVYLAGEFDLTAEVRRDGNLLGVRLTKAPDVHTPEPVPDTRVTEVTPLQPQWSVQGHDLPACDSSRTSTR